MSVERIELAPGLSVSRVLTGLWQIADMERDGQALDLEATAKAASAYGQAGFTTFDMADHYGSAEIVAGIYKKKYSGKLPVELFTKWVPVPGPVTRDEVRSAVQLALKRLQTDRIDLMQFHAWNYADPRWLDCLFWLQELSNEGLIRCLGLTNFDSAHLNMVINSGIKVVSNQVCYSLLDRRASAQMTEVCRREGVKLLAFGTLAGGFLGDPWLGKPEPSDDQLKTWSMMKYKRFIDAAGGWNKFQELLSTLEVVAKRYQVSISNIACRYMLEQPAVGGIIIGARLGRKAHLTENLRLFQFKLDLDSIHQIQSSLANLSPIPGDCGDEYRKPPFLTASGDLSHHIENLPPPYHVQPGVNHAVKAVSGTPWEDIAGFSRAIRKGNRILVSGTTATHGSIPIGGKDPAAQTHFVIDKIEGAVQSLGGHLEDVVRTRIFIRNISDWEAVARAHGQRFNHIHPANTMVKAELIGDEYLVEMEAEAIVS